MELLIEMDEWVQTKQLVERLLVLEERIEQKLAIGINQPIATSQPITTEQLAAIKQLVAMKQLVEAGEFIEILAADLEKSGSKRTGAAYRSAWRSVNRELKGEYTGWEIFAPEVLMLYERRMKKRGLSKGTTSFYLRMLRAIYNKGVAQGVCASYPGLFSGVYTGIPRTEKRAVNPELFGQMLQMDLSSKPKLRQTRDMFLLSFAMQGISYADLARLKKSNLKDGVLDYSRSKTQSRVKVPLTDWAKEMIDKYSKRTEGSDYLLPILTDTTTGASVHYESALRTYNRRLDKIKDLAKLCVHLTSYVARHTYATAARDADVSVGIISQAMGHSTAAVTGIYLADFNQKTLLSVNNKVLAAARMINSTDIEVVNGLCL